MAEINIDETKTRNYILRQYMFGILDTLLTNNTYQVNANFLSPDVNNYSLDRLPVQPIAENWIIPTKKFREVYEFRSRNTYGMEVAENIKNIGFFEELENKIYSNNKEGVLPEIEGIESIQCLNCGSLNIANTQDCVLSVQIQIEYLKEIKKATASL
jgi:hypothetical protein